jgi:hypothetical protein
MEATGSAGFRRQLTRRGIKLGVQFDKNRRVGSSLEVEKEPQILKIRFLKGEMENG